MRTHLCSAFIGSAMFVAFPVIARAHPGHGDHDFTWDFSHLAAHPIATLSCVAVLAAGAAIVWRWLKASSNRAMRSKLLR